MKTSVIISCEHGGNGVPPRFAPLFHNAGDVLASHRGYDPGSLDMGRVFARRCAAPLVASTLTRLLVELNRSIGHPRLFSQFTRELDDETKEALLARYYRPHREKVEALCRDAIAHGACAIHLGMHSFTPELNGEMRNADVGLLYDPRRPQERRLCDLWRTAIRNLRPDLVVRRNYPYFGHADGLTTTLRRRLDPAKYMGLELEVNQRWPQADKKPWKQLVEHLADAFLTAQVAFAIGGP